MRPATGVEREYVVETSGPISDDVLTQLQSGVSVEGVTYRISRFHRHAARRVSMILTEGKNREIRKMFAEFGIKVARIYRTRYGPIRLAGLPEGETRQLSDNEVDRLQRSTQVSRSAVQGGDAS
jgi:23S rRNA pseudouridine2605 synthase